MENCSSSDSEASILESGDNVNKRQQTLIKEHELCGSSSEEEDFMKFEPYGDDYDDHDPFESDV